MKNIVRFAPSPTGLLHIGGIRTALFNFIFAKSTQGKCLLRIEDTDKLRSEKKYVDNLIESFQWLNIDFDYIYYQSDRLHRHVSVIEQLLELNAAYFEYFEDGSKVVRLKTNKTGVTTFEDIVYGTMSVDNVQNDDMIILRSDNTPTYMLAVVVDDYDAGVTHVIRGSDHINNTFRQTQIYDALKWSKPRFCHIPLIHDDEGKKLSKRKHNIDLKEFKDKGFLPEAMLSYLLRLGCSYPNDDIITLSEAKENFSLSNIGRSPARYDRKKLQSINSYFIRHFDINTLYNSLYQTQLVDLDYNEYHIDESLIKNVLPLYTDRVSTLRDLKDKIDPFIRIEVDYNSSDVYKYINYDIVVIIYKKIKDLKGYDKKVLLEMTNSIVQYKKRDIFMSLRGVITCSESSPSILDLCCALGYEFVLSRLNYFLKTQDI